MEGRGGPWHTGLPQPEGNYCEVRFVARANTPLPMDFCGQFRELANTSCPTFRHGNIFFHAVAPGFSRRLQDFLTLPLVV